MIDYNTMLKIGEILKIAGENILDAKKNKLKISKKKDGTLVTNADLLSQKIIMEELNKLFNGEESIPMVSEELVEDGMVVEKAFHHFFLMVRILFVLILHISKIISLRLALFMLLTIKIIKFCGWEAKKLVHLKKLMGKI
jgi:hypothetical protein